MKKIIKYCIKNGIEFAYYPDLELWMFARSSDKKDKELLITHQQITDHPEEILYLIEERIVNDG